jgi:hypothetical protein
MDPGLDPPDDPCTNLMLTFYKNYMIKAYARECHSIADVIKENISENLCNLL